MAIVSIQTCTYVGVQLRLAIEFIETTVPLQITAQSIAMWTWQIHGQDFVTPPGVNDCRN